MTSLCKQTQDWLLTQHPQTPTYPPNPLCDHIATCVYCRGALLPLVTTLFGVPQDISEISCEDCQQDLAVYVDQELAEGVQAAAQRFPHVWWHLWVCTECAETHQMMLDILSPMDLSSAVAHVKQKVVLHQAVLGGRFEIPRVAFNRQVRMSQRLGVAWGEPDEGIVAFDEVSGAHEIRLILRPHDHGEWQVMVSVAPPISGQSIISFGSEEFRAPFGSDGIAIFTTIPGSLLEAPEGPDMAFWVEPI